MQEDGVPLLRGLVGGDHSTVSEIFLRRCALSESQTFVKTPERTWTYAQGLAESKRIAAYLGRVFAHGTSRRVCVLLDNGVNGLWAWFGTNLAGGVHCALNAGHRGALRSALLARVRAQVLVTSSAMLDSLGADLGQAGIQHVLVVDARGGAGPTADGVEVSYMDDLPYSDFQPRKQSLPGDVAALLYTSGTTGISKLVALPNNLFARGGARIAQSLDLAEGDVFHHWMPLHHIGGQLHGVMSTVIGGAALAIFPTFSTSQFLAQARHTGCTIFIGFANVLEYLLSTPESPSDREHPLRLGIIAGGSAPLRRRFESRFGTTLVDSYGMTEAEPLTLPSKTSIPSSGRINPDFEIAVLGADDRAVPIGDAGTIAFRPREPHIMMAEYDGDAPSTVSAWRNLWFHTSDIGRMDSQGHLFVLDRMQAAIRRRGENIASRDIETILMLHPEVGACAVLGIPAEGDTDIKAVVVLKSGSNLNSAELFTYCENNLARVMVPQVIEIRDSLPYTDIGKLDRSALLAVTGRIVPRPPR